MKHKVSELEGDRLRRAVALALGWKVARETSADNPLWRGGWYTEDPTGLPHSFSKHGFAPDLKWEQGGPIIERERIGIVAFTGYDEPDSQPRWQAFVETFSHYIDKPLPGHNAAKIGPTPLIAAMRAFVAAKLGDEVDL